MTRIQQRRRTKKVGSDAAASALSLEHLRLFVRFADFLVSLL